MTTTKFVRFGTVLVGAIALLAFFACKQPAPEADTNAPPAITITSHTNGQMVDGLITVAGTATDDAGVSKIEVSFDGGTTYTTASGTASWQIDFNTIAQADGNLFIKAKASDAGGYTAYAFVTLIIDNAGPSVQIISPQDGQKLSGRFAIVGIGTKLDSVELAIDGGAWSPVTGNYTWYKIWDTTVETEANHTVSVRPVRGGVPGDVETVTVFVDQTVPNVSFTAPTIGEYIKGTVAITGTASDNTSVARVEVSTNNGLTYSPAAGTTSWSLNLNTLTAGPSGIPLPDGARVLYARVVDEPGLFGLASIPVTVDNNPPTVAISSHANGTVVSGVVHLAGTSDDGVGVQKVEVQFGTAPLQLAEGTTSWNYDFNSAVLPNGAYDVAVTVTDFAGNSTVASVSVIADQSFPQVATINVNDGDYIKGIKALSGTVSDGDGLGDISKVEVKVGLDSYAAATYTTGAAPWSYDLNTAGYPPDGAKTVTVKVTDGVGGYGTLTRNVIFDNTPPSVAISSPANGGQVAGTVLVVGTVSDATSGISSMSITVDGASPGGAPTRNGNYWYYSWDTGPYSLASHTIVVTANDGALNANTATITVTKTTNIPSISIAAPLNGAFVRGSAVALSGTASASPGTVTRVDIQVDSTPPQTATGTTSWTHSLDTTGLGDGTHIIYATVTDSFALTTTTQITVTVDNTAPSISISNPTNGNVGANALHGTITISGTSSDTNLDLVETSIDGGLYGATTGTTSWEKSWNTATVAGVAKNGVVVAARASDKAGNTTTVQVTVDVRPYITSLSKYSSFRGDTVAVYGDNLVTGTPFTFKAGAGTTTGTLSWVALSSRFEVTVPATATSGNVHASTNGIAGNDVYLNIWGIDVVPSSNNGQYPSLALDASDNIYVAFGRGGNTKTLAFSRYNGSAWTTVSGIDSLAGATYVSVALGGSTRGSNVYIAYYNSDQTLRQLRLVKSTTSGASFGTPMNVAAFGLYSSVEAYYNIGAATDYVYIAYYDSTTQDLKIATSTDAGATFTHVTIDSTGDVGRYASLALDGGHNPRIAYYDATNRRLKLAYWDEVTEVWRTRVIDSATSVGEYASLAVASDGSLHIGYYDGFDADEQYATLSGPASSITLESTDTDGVTGWYGSLVLDSFGDPRVSYYDVSLQVLRYASRATGSWETLTVPETAAIGATPTSIGVDSVGVQRIGYVGGGEVKVARYLP